MNRAFLFLLFLLLAGKMCAQQVAGTLTLKEAEQRFLERNLSLIAERYNIDMAQAQVLQAKLFENPVILPVSGTSKSGWKKSIRK